MQTILNRAVPRAVPVLGAEHAVLGAGASKRPPSNSAPGQRREEKKTEKR